MDTPARRRCEATSKQSGQRCKRRPIPGGTVCVMHGGAAPQVRLAAEERLLTLQDSAISRLAELIAQKEFPSTAMSAVKDVLDRTMGRPVKTEQPRADVNVEKLVLLIQRAPHDRPFVIK